MDLKRCLVPSPDVVIREIEGEVIIVPIVAGIGDLEDEIFTLNSVAAVILRCLDGKRTLQDVVDVLSKEFEAEPTRIEADVVGLTGELLQRKILIDRDPA